MKLSLNQMKIKKMTQAFILLFIICSCSQNAVNQNDSMIEKITIKKVDFYTFTIVTVECKEFDKYFKNDFSFSTLSSRKDINAFLSLFNDSLPLDSNFNHYVVDTRVKAEVFYKDGKVENICIGNPAYEKDGVLYRNTNRIKEYIENINPD